jgi:hypothetical protein
VNLNCVLGTVAAPHYFNAGLSPAFHLKVLFSEMDQAESRLIQ